MGEMAHAISETWKLQGGEDVAEVAESYVLGRLTPSRRDEYEAHLLLCGVCRREVENIGEFIETLRLAVDGIDPLPLWSTLARKD